MKKITLLATAVVVTFCVMGCNSGGGTSSSPLTATGKMVSGMGGAVTTIQNLGAALGSGNTFSLNQRNVSSLAAGSKCTVHAEPGTDANLNGIVSDAEKMSNTDPKYALQKFYCTLASDSTGPESVSGAVNLIKTITCAIEKQLGTLAFDNTPVAITGITLDLSCATQAQINNMTNGTGAVTIAGGATVTSALNPTFAEIPGNTHYSHGIKIVSNDNTSLKFIILAKFDPASPNPLQSGDFEFATVGTGTMMQGTAIEFTAGKIYGTGTTKHLWYESRSNRAKTSIGDPICPGTSGSCGFSRHIRLSTDISFLNGDIDSVSNMSGIMTDGGDSTGSSGQSNNMNLVTATGSLSSGGGITGKLYNKNSAPSTLTGGSTILNTFTGGEIGTTSCITAAGLGVTTACSGAPAPLSPAGAINIFFSPANSTAWIVNASTKGGLGYSGETTFADEQFVNP
jgi:hypothetical protein